MGWLSDYRRKRRERHLKRDEVQAAARKSLHDEPSATRRRIKNDHYPGNGGGP